MPNFIDHLIEESKRFLNGRAQINDDIGQEAAKFVYHGSIITSRVPTCLIWAVEWAGAKFLVPKRLFAMSIFAMDLRSWERIRFIRLIIILQRNFMSCFRDMPSGLWTVWQRFAIRVNLFCTRRIVFILCGQLKNLCWLFTHGAAKMWWRFRNICDRMRNDEYGCQEWKHLDQWRLRDGKEAVFAYGNYWISRVINDILCQNI